ncbi:endonuclease III domain-containing protein [Aeoliella sp. ICT_H6.2]|uniref:Endonuclease III domain-containing protein n=1 Tax=Aeoliella straminimaris TaxID=2954799 RepID=A0A9X2FE37_9BACT|nr:endonuclease III domain-containing protein [Aeoliella straminimaris]MCO6046493.1 endonuclease III domain-containing protein [Aeoliella straminimaris]
MPRRPPPLLDLYEEMYAAFGPQHWWPGDSPLEVVIGAVLVQNTAWRNVERAIANLKQHNLIDVDRLYAVEVGRLEELVQPAGYFRVKARRLRNLLEFVIDRHEGSLDRLFELPMEEARRQLLEVNGVGPETADSILLYAGEQPKFVVDAYTRRVLLRHGWLAPPATYEAMQKFFERRLPAEVPLYNEYHALIVRIGNQYCRSQPKCEECPLKGRLPRGGPIEL